MGLDQALDIQALTVGLAVGQRAPIVRLRSQHGETVDLDDRLPALVVFFPFAFSSLCTSELAGLNLEPAFGAAGVDVVAISCDPIYSLRSMADAEQLTLLLLSDFWPHGHIAKQFDCFDEQAGAATRSSYLLDSSGRVSWAVHHGMAQERSLALHSSSLENL